MGNVIRALVLALKGSILAGIALFIIPQIAYSGGSVLVLRADGESFEQISRGIEENLGDDFDIHSKIVQKNTSIKTINKYLNNTAPNIIVLMGNNAVILYAEYQKTHPAAEFPPSFALAALYLDELIKRLKNSTGIRYEIPAVTSIVNLRAFIKIPVNKCGVIYQEWMEDFFQTNKKYCKAEGIELIGVRLSDKEKDVSHAIEKGLRQLINEKVDLLWILNNNILLNPKVIRQAWMPVLSKFKKPVIVGIKPLITTTLNFGTFAVLPDHYALGTQAAGSIIEIMEDNWNIESREVEQPLSVMKLLNITLTEKKKIPIHKNKLDEIDILVR